MLLTIHSSGSRRIALLETGEAERDRRVHDEAEHAEREAGDQAARHPAAFRRLLNTPRKNTAAIGGAR